MHENFDLAFATTKARVADFKLDLPVSEFAHLADTTSGAPTLSRPAALGGATLCLTKRCLAVFSRRVCKVRGPPLSDTLSRE